MSGTPVPPDGRARPPAGTSGTSGPPGRRAGPAAALAAASAHYLRGEPIDMSALAAELGVGRATLYRWVGSREQLLGAVLAELTERTYRVATRGVGGSGPERILLLLDRFMRAVVDAEPLKAFTEREPRLFIRLATMPGTIEDRCTELLAKELQAEIDRGAMRAPHAGAVAVPGAVGQGGEGQPGRRLGHLADDRPARGVGGVHHLVAQRHAPGGARPRAAPAALRRAGVAHGAGSGAASAPFLAWA